MKRWRLGLLLLIVCLLVGCRETDAPVIPDTQQTEASAQALVETVEKIAQQNLFGDVTAFDGVLLKGNTEQKDWETNIHQVQMLDIYGNLLSSCSISAEKGYSICGFLATQDGGFLVMLGSYRYLQPQPARIIKCDSSGTVQFDTPLQGVDGNGLKYCFEKNGKYFIFGERETPETKVEGVYSPSDISVIILDQEGKHVKTRYIGGSDYDDLNVVEPTDKGFLLSVTAQSDDGDFAGSASGGFRIDWVIEIDEELEICAKERKTGRACGDKIIGWKDGVALYQSDAIFADFDRGSPEALVDYGDHYLIVSGNITGEYENTPPYISMLWYYMEQVYSLYDEEGNLLYRTAIDISPDYDAMAESWYTPHSDLYLPEYTLQQIQEYFDEVVLASEYTDGTGDATLVQKWLSPIYYRVYGAPTQEDMDVLEDLFAQLNAVPEFPGIYAAGEGEEENLSISFLDRPQFKNEFDAVVNGEESFGAAQYWYYNANNEIHTARIGYRTDISQETRNSVLVEEIVNILGITDTVLREDSIVYQYSDDNTALSEVDWVILKLLYSPRICCGMDRSSCASVIEELYR